MLFDYGKGFLLLFKQDKNAMANTILNPVMSCIVDITGATDSDCACITSSCSDDDKEKMAVSKSGLYIADVEGGVSFAALKQGDTASCKNLCQIMLAAKAKAEKRLSDDIIALLGQNFSTSKQKYTGYVGETAYTATLTGITKRYAGIKIKGNDITDGVLKITGIELLLNLTTTIKDLYIVRAYQSTSSVGEVVQRIQNISVTANVASAVPLPDPIFLPLRFNNSAVNYFLVYDTVTDDGTIVPKNNKAMCDCGNQKSLLNQFMQVYGANVADFNTLTASSDNSKFANGVRINTVIFCDTNQFVCREFDNKDAVAVVMSYAAQYKAAEFVIEEIQKDPAVNRYTMQGRDYLWGKRTHFLKEYQNRIQWISENVDINNTDCFICKTEKDIRVTGIVS